MKIFATICILALLAVAAPLAAPWGTLIKWPIYFYRYNSGMTIGGYIIRWENGLSIKCVPTMYNVRAGAEEAPTMCGNSAPLRLPLREHP